MIGVFILTSSAVIGLQQPKLDEKSRELIASFLLPMHTLGWKYFNEKEPCSPKSARSYVNELAFLGFMESSEKQLIGKTKYDSVYSKSVLNTTGLRTLGVSPGLLEDIGFNDNTSRQNYSFMNSCIIISVKYLPGGKLQVKSKHKMDYNQKMGQEETVPVRFGPVKTSIVSISGKYVRIWSWK